MSVDLYSRSHFTYKRFKTPSASLFGAFVRKPFWFLQNKNQNGFRTNAPNKVNKLADGVLNRLYVKWDFANTNQHSSTKVWIIWFQLNFQYSKQLCPSARSDTFLSKLLAIQRYNLGTTAQIMKPTRVIIGILFESIESCPRTQWPNQNAIYSF